MFKQTPARLISSLLFIFALLFSGNASPASGNPTPLSSHIIYVNENAVGANNGTSWANAFTDLQAALGAATAGDEIWVAAGTYKPTTVTTDRDATFTLKNGVALYGGFAGTETQRDQRDWATNITILSGDINNSETLDGNAYSVVTGSGTDATAVIDGFTITMGNADATVGNFFDPSRSGGGMYNTSSSPTVTNSTFSGNSAGDNGGGMFNTGGSPTVTNSIIWNNSANGTTATTSASVFNLNSSVPTFSYSLIANSGGSGSWDNAIGTNGGNNIAANPLFIETPNPATAPTTAGNLRLRAGSPAIDVGNNAANSTPADLAGNVRIINTTIDLGAYEAVATTCPAGGVRFVDRNASLPGDGLSWDSAYRDLQDALAVTVPCEIWVAAGTYKPTDDPTARTATFRLRNGVALYGGFVGTETQRDQRDWATNITTLSGDINNSGTLNGNAYSVVTGSGTNATAVIDGFTITMGNANATSVDPFSPNHSGGGMYNNGGSPTVTNSTFSGNSAGSNGGGMFNIGSSPAVTNSTFSGNSAGTNGGGMFNHSSSPTVTNSTFSGNSAERDGGGMFNNNSSSPVVTNSTFSGNSAERDGGGMFNNNSSSPVVTNSTFSGNSAGTRGGGMFNQSSSPTVTNSTFSGNSAGSDGGGMYNVFSSPTVTNSIIWNNSATGETTTASASVFNNSSTPTFSYSLIANSGGSGSWVGAIGTDNGNNIAANPLFIETPNPATAPTTAGNLRLQASSPAFDAGNDAVVGVATDLDGNPRIMGTAVDMGAYELIAFLLQINIAGQGTVTPQPDEAAYLAGSVVTLTAVADPGWSFAAWSGDLSGTINPETIVMDSAKVVTATFSNNPPVADAGAEQTVAVNTLVTLDGTGSYDEDLSQTLTYGWAQTGGTAVILNDNTAVSPTFTAPTSPAVLTFTLVVTDSFGLASLPDTVVITVEDVAVSDLNAASSSPTTLGQTTSFTATIATGSNVSYAWDFGDGNGGAGALPSHVYATAGTFTATVTATNQTNSQTATTLVTITNEPPVADAGSDQTTEVNQAVALDGSGSTDPDGHLPLTFGWTQTGGVPVLLSDNTAVQPTFTSPMGRTVLTFTLVVTDSFGQPSSPDTVMVTVQEPEITIHKAANPTTANIGDLITYTYTLTNSGDVPLSGINPLDDQLGLVLAQPISLTEGQSISATLFYTVAEADLPGPLLNTVIVSGTSPLGNVVQDSDWAAVILTSQPAIHIIKEANVGSVGMNGVLTYTYTVMNVGDVTLTGITAVDTPLGPVPLLTDTLPSLGMTTRILTYTVSESDLPGPLVNSVTVTGTSPINELVTAQDSFTVTVTSAPSLLVTLTAVPELARPSETVTFTLTLHNNGDVTLHDLSSVTSLPSDFALSGDLAPGASLSVSGSYTVLAADLPGPLSNSVTVTATPTAGAALQVGATATVTLTLHMAYLPLVQVADTEPLPDLIIESVTATAGQVSITIRNEGLAPVTTPFWLDLFINPTTPPTAVNQTSDDLGGTNLAWGITTSFAPGESVTLLLEVASASAMHSTHSGEIPTAVPLYVHVDSFNLDREFGGVLERHEVDGTAYNNIAGPIYLAPALDMERRVVPTAVGTTASPYPRRE